MMSIARIFTPYEERLRGFLTSSAVEGPQRGSPQSMPGFIIGWRRNELPFSRRGMLPPTHLLIDADSGEVVPLPLCLSFSLFLSLSHLQYTQCRRRYRHSYSTNVSWHVIISSLLNLITPFPFIGQEIEAKSYRLPWRHT